jgi:hypothetical protein
MMMMKPNLDLFARKKGHHHFQIELLQVFVQVNASA